MRTKKILSLVLAFVLMISAVPTTAFAQSGGNYIAFTSAESFELSTANSQKNWTAADSSKENKIEYSTDLSTWNIWDGAAALTAGQSSGEYVLYLRGTNNSTISGYGKAWRLSGDINDNRSNGIYCSGNIENLLDYATVAAGNHPTMGNQAFQYLFSDEENYSYDHKSRLVSAPQLPATTLSSGCYGMMFAGTSITTTPELPATTLAEYCYNNMFYNCKSLKSVTSLPTATTLANGCYASMFNSCSALYVTTTEITGVTSWTAPTGLSTTHAENMFYLTAGDLGNTQYAAPPAEQTYYLTSTYTVDFVVVNEGLSVTIPTQNILGGNTVAEPTISYPAGYSGYTAYSDAACQTEITLGENGTKITADTTIYIKLTELQKTQYEVTDEQLAKINNYFTDKLEGASVELTGYTTESDGKKYFSTYDTATLIITMPVGYAVSTFPTLKIGDVTFNDHIDGITGSSTGYGYKYDYTKGDLGVENSFATNENNKKLALTFIYPEQAFTINEFKIDYHSKDSIDNAVIAGELTKVFDGQAFTPNFTYGTGVTPGEIHYLIKSSTGDKYAYSYPTLSGTTGNDATAAPVYPGIYQVEVNFTMPAPLGDEWEYFEMRILPDLTLTNKTVDYTGAAVSIVEIDLSKSGVPESVRGAFGNRLQYTYYTDAAGTIKTTTANGAEQEGGAPKNPGTYYVYAELQSDWPIDISDVQGLFQWYYPAAKSNLAKLTINKLSPIPAPENLQWDSTAAGKATWDAAANAIGYFVQLYKDGTAQGGAVSITGTEYDFSAAITTAGSYTFKVKALGDMYEDSPESTSSALSVYGVTLNTDNLSSATATLSKDTGIFADDTVTLTITPSTGFTFQTAPFVYVNGATAGTLTKGADGVYTCTISSFTANATVTVSDTAIAPTYEIRVSASPEVGGKADGAGDYDLNESVTVTATANTGYHFVRWTENSNEVSKDAEYTFNVTSDRSLVAVFEADSATPPNPPVPPTPVTPTQPAPDDWIYIDSGMGGSVTNYASVTASANLGGSIAPSGTSLIPEGGKLTYTIAPAQGYKIADVIVDGISVGKVSSYTFANIKGAHTIEAMFEKVGGGALSIPKTGYSYELYSLIMLGAAAMLVSKKRK